MSTTTETTTPVMTLHGLRGELSISIFGCRNAQGRSSLSLQEILSEKNPTSNPLKDILLATSSFSQRFFAPTPTNNRERIIYNKNEYPYCNGYEGKKALYHGKEGGGVFLLPYTGYLVSSAWCVVVAITAKIKRDNEETVMFVVCLQEDEALDSNALLEAFAVLTENNAYDKEVFIFSYHIGDIPHHHALVEKITLICECVSVKALIKQERYLTQNIDAKGTPLLFTGNNHNLIMVTRNRPKK